MKFRVIVLFYYYACRKPIACSTLAIHSSWMATTTKERTRAWWPAWRSLWWAWSLRTYSTSQWSRISTHSRTIKCRQFIKNLLQKSQFRLNIFHAHNSSLLNGTDDRFDDKGKVDEIFAKKYKVSGAYYTRDTCKLVLDKQTNKWSRESGCSSWEPKHRSNFDERISQQWSFWFLNTFLTLFVRILCSPNWIKCHVESWSKR